MLKNRFASLPLNLLYISSTCSKVLNWMWISPDVLRLWAGQRIAAGWQEVVLVNYSGIRAGRFHWVALSDGFNFMLEAVSDPAIISQVACRLFPLPVYIFLALSSWMKVSDLDINSNTNIYKYRFILEIHAKFASSHESCRQLDNSNFDYLLWFSVPSIIYKKVFASRIALKPDSADVLLEEIVPKF